MHDVVYKICSDTLVAALALAESQPQPDLPSARRRFLTSLEQMAAEGARLGIAAADLAEARYALVAFIDEQVLRSRCSWRGEWMKQPLQLLLYQESAAGENFFIRLRALLRMSDRLAAIQAYGLCLLLGFRGAYGQSDDLRPLSMFTQAVERKLVGALPSPDIISPHLRRAAGKPRPSRAKLRLLAVGAAAVALAIFIVGLCAWSVSRASELALIEVELSFDPQGLAR